MEKVENSVKAVAISVPFTVYFLIKTIMEKNWSMSGYFVLILCAGIYAIGLWIKPKGVII